jgi:hypothetical protein
MTDSYDYEYIAPEADVIVGMGEFGTATNGESIATYGLGTCTGVGMYDATTETAYMTHSDGVVDLRQLAAVVGAISSTRADAAKLKAWVAGAMDVTVDGEVMEMTQRDEVLEVLTAAGILEVSVEVRWLEPGEVADIVIDSATGEGQIVVDYEDMWYQDDVDD